MVMATETLIILGTIEQMGIYFRWPTLFVQLARLAVVMDLTYVTQIVIWLYLIINM